MNENILKEVGQERERQEKKRGEQNHEPPKWFTILMEEVGEACKAELDKKEEWYRFELIQVAAVAVAMIDSFDRKKKKITYQFLDSEKAIAEAKRVSKYYDYVCVVKEHEAYYVETEVPLIGKFEGLVYEYKHGGG